MISKSRQGAGDANLKVKIGYGIPYSVLMNFCSRCGTDIWGPRGKWGHFLCIMCNDKVERQLDFWDSNEMVNANFLNKIHKNATSYQ